jgi:twitching motility protein PilU
VRTLDGALVPAVEVLLNTPYIADLILKGKIEDIKDAMAQNVESDAQTFDQALVNLYREGHISEDEAINNADSKTNVRLEIKLWQTHQGLTKVNIDHMSINPEGRDNRGRPSH